MGINVMKESTHGNLNLPIIIQPTKHVKAAVKKVVRDNPIKKECD